MRDRLRIAQLAPIATPVGPGAPDSIGQLVHLLTEELVRRGHHVTLFATGDSRTSARLLAFYRRGYEADAGLWDWQFHEVMHASRAFELAGEFDVIHSHAYHYALPFAGLVATPVVHTYHVEMDPDIAAAYASSARSHVIALSEAQKRGLNGIGDVPVIHHGIDTGAFRFSLRRGAYLAFLGRIIPEKGPVEAIHTAARAGMPLVMAGPYDGESGYFEAEVAPLLDGEWARYVGLVGAKARNRLLAGAAALLYPIADPEPFGLVLVEAMACGTPVVATGLGAVPELVDPGVTGYYADEVDALAGCVAAAVKLDRLGVRCAAVERFDYRRMVDDHEALYRRLAGG